MADEDAFDCAVAELYLAAVGELPWRQPLTRIVEMLDAFGAYLHGINLADGTVNFGYDVGGFAPEAALHYIRDYHAIDPRVPLVAHAEVGEWVSCHHHIDDAAVALSPFYQDFLIPSGGRYVSGAKVYQDREIIAILGIHRGIGMQPLGEAELAIGRRLGVHVANALGIWRRQRRKLRETLLGTAVLQRMTQPLLLLDEQLQLHFCSEAARTALAADPRLRIADKALHFGSRHDRAQLVLALRELSLGAEAAFGRIAASQDRKVVRIDSPAGEPPLLLVLLALRPQETLGAFGPVPLAIALVHDLAARATPDPLLVAAAFGLTPAESRVAVQLAAGASVPETADTLGVARSTVRTHLLQVFQKVGVNRQQDLAFALAGLGVLAAAEPPPAPAPAPAVLPEPGRREAVVAPDGRD
ncbi:MAG: helix-turn-helix transcriptional regulator [Proteobacteria bacterium]|nr:helix-turn-helix transcriptional regulator [Pseudomonadota bacterium]